MNGKSTEIIRAVVHGHGFAVTKLLTCADDFHSTGVCIAGCLDVNMFFLNTCDVAKQTRRESYTLTSSRRQGYLLF